MLKYIVIMVTMLVVLLATACVAAAAPAPEDAHYNLRNDKYLYKGSIVTQKTVYKENDLGFKTSNASAPVLTVPSYPDGVDLPKSFDWRKHGVVTPVKNSYIACNPARVFSAIASIESQYAMKHNQCISLSEQQCLDCLPDTDCEHGGEPDDVMINIAKHGYGCVKMEDYPYVEVKQYSCKEKRFAPVAKVTSATVLGVDDEDNLMKVLIAVGPLVVKVDFFEMLRYMGGIMKCRGKRKFELEVLLVGYGEEEGSGTKFWIVKNAAGRDFGEDGYARLRRGDGKCIRLSYIAVAGVE